MGSFPRRVLVAAAMTVAASDVSAQTLDSVKVYVAQLVAAEQAARGVTPSPMDAFSAKSSSPGWASALAEIVPPSGFEKLHRSLVRNARIIVASGNQVRAFPDSPSADDARERLQAAIDAYMSSHLRLTRRLKLEWGIEMGGWYAQRTPRM